MIVREYIDSDAKKIREIDSRVFDECKLDTEEITAISHHGGNRLFVAELLGEIVGFICLVEVKTLHYDGMWVDLIAVVPEHQGKGVGARLIEVAVQYVTKTGKNLITALVADDNLASLGVFYKREFSSSDSKYHIMSKSLNVIVPEIVPGD